MTKSGDITPVSMSGKANSCPDCCLIIKVLVCLLVKYLNTFGEKNLFPNLQFGISKGLGACDALQTITNFVQKALDSGCEVHMVGLDYSASSDCVYHNALTFKLTGVGGLFLNL